ncbi:hypothetical protein T10_10243 [Trichinella papuae]|uniref:Uncharacterized protein n=1 Tax=Trichinella papuae TaxID=268474 RepID=A0A0V1NAH2_9BILA|nr:hypothetical protein T10_10243 [Trichinella papuae]
MKCMNYWPVSICENYINIYGKSMCTKNILFGRYQCCISCAKVLKVTVNEDGTFESKDNFKFYDESCPEATDRMVAGNSWTPWCLAYKDEADGTNCENAIFQYRCYKTCNIDCGNAQPEHPPAPES